jgi:hypothetical protein
MKNRAKTEEEAGSLKTRSVEGQGALVCGVKPKLGFAFGNYDNFVVIVDGGHLGAQDGKTCSDGKFPSAESEQSWMAWQLLFQRSFLERLERYVELRLAELAAAPVKEVSP